MYVKAKLISELGEFKVEIARWSFHLIVNPDGSYIQPSDPTKSAVQWGPMDIFSYERILPPGRVKFRIEYDADEWQSAMCYEIECLNVYQDNVMESDDVDCRNVVGLATIIIPKKICYQQESK